MSKTMVMCSSCKKIMGTKSSDISNFSISHGICPPCLSIIYSNDFSKEELQKIIDNAKSEKLGYHIPTIVISIIKFWFHNLTENLIKA